MAKNLFSAVYNAIPSSVERNRVQELLSGQETRIRDFLQKAYEVDDNTVKGTKIYSMLDRQLKRNDGYRGRPIDYINKLISKRLKDRDILLEAAEAAFGSKVYKEAIDYNRIQLLTYIAMVDWFIDAAHAFINTAVNEVTFDTENPYKSPADKEAMNFIYNTGNLMNFARVCDAMNVNVKDAVEKLKGLEGLSFIPEEMTQVQKEYGVSGVDPMQSGFIPVFMNPGALFGSIYNLLLKKRLEEDKEKVKTLKTKVYRLQAQRNGASPEELEKLDKQILHNSERISILTQEIEDILADD